MSAPNMATLTASLERSLRNCSLNHHHTAPSAAIAASSSSSSTGLSRSNSSDGASRFQASLLQDLSSSNSPPTCDSTATTTTTTLVDLNSHVSLPYHWEQCLDLQTGEIYYKNWRNGMKASEDPRLVTRGACSEDVEFYETEEDIEDEDEDEEEEEEESYDSEGSSSNSCNSSYRMLRRMRMRNEGPEDVLVVAGCKSCLMYYMVPKHVLHCPKCTGQLLHFDRHRD